MNNIETLEWFDKFYKKYKKFVDIILAMDKKKMIEYEIPDIYSLLREDEEVEMMKVYRIKGFTKFDFKELQVCGETKEVFLKKGKPILVTCYSNYFPGIRTMGNKTFLDMDALLRLREVFKKLMINLEFYKEYSNLPTK